VAVPSTVNAINVAHAGIPREKFFVPSIGSSTQSRPTSVTSPPPSSPSTASAGRSAVINARSASSAAVSRR
jgi:hypothetical protein